MVEWTKTDTAAAQAEGWDIFQSDECLRLERLDDPGSIPELGFTRPKFADDYGAWRHVVAGTAADNPLHVKALAYLRENSPGEYAEIVEHTT